MAPLEFNNADAAQMVHMQQVITKALLPFKARVEAALVCFALVRCARILVNLYPEALRRELVSVLCDYLENKDTPPGPAAQSPIWTPEMN